MKYKIGIDIGTTNIKAVLYDENLNRVSMSSEGLRTYHDQMGYAEQNPEEVLNAFYRVLDEILLSMSGQKKEVELLSFSSAMHSLILMGKDHELLTRSIIWSDNRAVNEVEEFKRNEDWLKHYRNTGTPIHPMSPFFKLLWIGKNTGLLEKTGKIMGIKEYILMHLTGECVMDYSMASATGMLNIHNLAWDEEALRHAGITEALLPALKDVTEKVSVENRSILEKPGLSSELEIMLGASDGCLANLGSQALHRGETTVTIGTSGAVRMTVDAPVLDDAGRTFCYYLMKDKWVIGGAVNNGGNVLAWLGRTIHEEEETIYKDLENRVKDIPKGSEGLLFIPYLHGERAPHWDGRLNASFIGLSAFHGRDHLIRSAVEGMVFNLREVWEMLTALSGDSTTIIASGGFLESAVWTGILSDVFGRDIEISDAADSSCLGAVLLDHEPEGLKAQGHRETMRCTNENHEEYQLYYRKYIWYAKKMAALQKEAREMFE
ncbi:gluconokinase [Proteiniclasticum sp. C24MP]|uniref:gluconokinase n=1 Tax=Proteiniclasticum sp. C24MP TaxID=3374101 RepID=UPI00375493E1